MTCILEQGPGGGIQTIAAIRAATAMVRSVAQALARPVPRAGNLHRAPASVVDSRPRFGRRWPRLAWAQGALRQHLTRSTAADQHASQILFNAAPTVEYRVVARLNAEEGPGPGRDLITLGGPVDRYTGWRARPCRSKAHSRRVFGPLWQATSPQGHHGRARWPP